MQNEEGKSALLKARVQLKQLYDVLQKVEDNTGFSEGSVDDRMYRSLLCKAKNNLEDILSIAYNIDAPIVTEGILYKNSAGRYEMNDSHYFTSGSSIEVLIYDDFYENHSWVSSSVEHQNGDYYVVACPKLKMDGMRARVRKYNSPFY